MSELQYALKDGVMVQFKKDSKGEKYATWQVNLSDNKSYCAVYYLTEEETLQFKDKYEPIQTNNFEKIYKWLNEQQEKATIYEKKEMERRVSRIVNSLNKKEIGNVLSFNLEVNSKSNDLNGIVECSNGTFEIWNSKATSKNKIHYRLQISKK